MGTHVSDIYDMFLQLVTDYRLTELFNISGEDFENFMEVWLKNAIVDFSICNQSLKFDETSKYFEEELTDENKIILSNLILKYWSIKNVNDITQMNLHITDRDFKVFSEAQNLREKINNLNNIKETCSQMLQDYGYKNHDWSKWATQNFFG